MLAVLLWSFISKKCWSYHQLHFPISASLFAITKVWISYFGQAWLLKTAVQPSGPESQLPPNSFSFRIQAICWALNVFLLFFFWKKFPHVLHNRETHHVIAHSFLQCNSTLESTQLLILSNFKSFLQSSPQTFLGFDLKNIWDRFLNDGGFPSTCRKIWSMKNENLAGRSSLKIWCLVW